METSGIVSTNPYDVQKIIEHGMRRAGYVPERISGEGQLVARDLLFTLMAEWVNVGMQLWTQEYRLLSIAAGSPDVFAPDGTVDFLHAYWRILNPWRGPAFDGSGADVRQLFAGQPNADVVIAGPNPVVGLNFTSQTEVDTVGVFLGGAASITTALDVLVSVDNGQTYTRAQSLPSATYQPGKWTYFDLNPSITAQYVQLRYNSASNWTLNQLNFGLANGTDIEAGPLSIDDYYNLPNKQFQADQPVSTYTDRQTVPQLKVWPTPSVYAFYNGTFAALMRRYPQDPGSFTNMLEMPSRWYEATLWRLAHKLTFSLPDEEDASEFRDAGAALRFQLKQQRQKSCDTNAVKAEALAWGEERTRGPIRIYPNLSCYTR